VISKQLREYFGEDIPKRNARVNTELDIKMPGDILENQEFQI